MNKYVGWFTLSIQLCLTGLFLALNLKEIRIDKNISLAFLIIVLNLAISSFNNREQDNFLINFVQLFIAFTFVTSISFQKFIQLFTKFMYFLACFSLVAYIVTLVLPQVLAVFPITTNILAVEAYNLGFTVIPFNSYIIRNFGFFWEPGAYQAFLNLALLLYLFTIKKFQWKPIFIITVTVLTTFSTTGYICMFLIYIAYLGWRLKDKHAKNNRKLLIALLFCICMMALIVFYSFLPSHIQHQLFGKISEYFSDQDSLHTASTSVRFDAVRYSAQAFLESPFWGWGRSGLQGYMRSYGLTMITCTPLNWFAIYGIAMGIICNFGLYLFTKKCFHDSSLFIVFLWGILILSIASEDFSRNPCILIFVFYGFTMYNEQPDSDKMEKSKILDMRFNNGRKSAIKRLQTVNPVNDDV